MSDTEFRAGQARISKAKAQWRACEFDGAPAWANALNGVIVTVDPRLSDPSAEVL